MKRQMKAITFERMQPYAYFNRGGVVSPEVFDMTGFLKVLAVDPVGTSLKEQSGDFIRFQIVRPDTDISTGLWEIQVLRLRDKIMPGIASVDNGEYEVVQLAEGEYYAESNTILYDSMMRDLYIQKNRYALGIGALERYLHQFIPCERIELRPYQNSDIQKINTGKQYRKIIITLAKPKIEQENVHGRLKDIIALFHRYQSEYIKIEISVGKSRVGFMNTSEAVELIQEAFEYPDTNSLSVNLYDPDDNEIEFVNLLDDRFVIRFPVEYSRDNPIVHARVYMECRELLLKKRGI